MEESYNDAGDNSGQQIESSDEYDPAQDVQAVPLPAVDPPNNASQPIPTHTNLFTVSSATGDDTAQTQYSTVKSPTSADDPNNSRLAEDLHSPTSTVIKTRLPHDKIGLLEDRIKDDEKGDLDAWMSLIGEYRKRGKVDDVRKVYKRFFDVFPQAADQWVFFTQFESESGNKGAAEEIFQNHLKSLASLPFWSAYLDHIRRHFNIAVDTSGNASQINHAAYEAVLDAVGMDKDSGRLWADYIQFIKSGPGVVGQTDWQGQQKMDLLRKAYTRAICIPNQAVESIWKDYTNFEMNLNKVTGRKYLQEKSPDYMSARSSYTELQNITRDLNRTTLPILPPALGFDGDLEYMKQVEIWNKWIHWEKNDPLVLKQDNLEAYKQRIIYAYKQAVMALRFWPEIWFDAADFCFDNSLESEGNEFLSQGILANPESCLLAFKQGDRQELSTTNGDDDDSKQQRGLKVQESYDKVLDALYQLLEKAKARETKDIARIEAEFATGAPDQNGNADQGEDERDAQDEEQKRENEAKKHSQLSMVKAISNVQASVLNKTISYAWVALMRCMYRMQGKGKPGAKIGGSRHVFTRARKRGGITSDVWITAALLEYHSGDAEAAKRIFERGSTTFLEDEKFCLEHIKFLTEVNDHTNARVVFEVSVNKLSEKPETKVKAKPLYAFFHQYESKYGQLAQIIKLEARMKDLYPDDPRLSSFSQRFVIDKFDPTAIRPLISPATQTRPKLIPTIEAPPSRQPSPRSSKLPFVVTVPNSPKRPLPMDIVDDIDRPRKMIRGESPMTGASGIAGAAGRRLDQLKRTRQPGYDGTQSAGPGGSYAAPPPPLPRDVLFMLSVIPPASTYHSAIFKPEEVIRIFRELNIPTSINQLPQRPPVGGPQYGQAPPGQYNVPPSYNR